MEATFTNSPPHPIYLILNKFVHPHPQPPHKHTHTRTHARVRTRMEEHIFKAAMFSIDSKWKWQRSPRYNSTPHIIIISR